MNRIQKAIEMAGKSKSIWKLRLKYNKNDQESIKRVELYEFIIETLKKQIPIKVNEIHLDEYKCPACGAENCCNDRVIRDKFCPECGQAIYQEKLGF